MSVAELEWLRSNDMPRHMQKNHHSSNISARFTVQIWRAPVSSLLVELAVVGRTVGSRMKPRSGSSEVMPMSSPQGRHLAALKVPLLLPLIVPNHRQFVTSICRDGA